MDVEKYTVEEYQNTKHCDNCVNKKSDDILVENKKEGNVLATIDKFAMDHPVATVAAVAFGISFLTTVGAIAIISEGVYRGNMKTLYSLYRTLR